MAETEIKSINGKTLADVTAREKKLDKNQGVANAGKILGIGEDGIVVPQDIPQGGDNSLGITAAAVGQIIKVKSVDTTGKPTEWEAADLDKDEYVVLVNTKFAENKLNTDMWLDETLYATTHVWRSATPLDLICMCIYVPAQTENIITSGELKVGVLSVDKDSNYWDLPPEAPYFGYSSFVPANGQNRYRKLVFDLRTRTAEAENGNNIARNTATTSIACMPQFGKYYSQSAYLQAISIRLVTGSLPAGTELFVYGRKNNGNRIKHPGWSVV